MFEKNLNGKFLFVRHGLTEFNKIQNETHSESIEFIGEYSDAVLSQEGIAQAINAQKFINNIKIEKVYCSPLKRALETCLKIFESHPNKDNIIIEVFPLVTEFLNICYDFPNSIEENKKIYNMNSKVKFNWKSFEEIFGEKQNLFFLSYLDNLNEEEYNKFYKIFEEANKNKTMDKAIEELVKYKKENNISTLESYKHIFNRTQEFKKYLKEKHSGSIDDLSQKIIIVTHGGFIKFSTSKSVLNQKEINDWPKDCCFADNCEFISVNI
jgi:broad specificity phosphatase PhoE